MVIYHPGKIKHKIYTYHLGHMCKYDSSSYMFSEHYNYCGYDMQSVSDIEIILGIMKYVRFE